MIAAALQLGEVESSRLDKPPRGKFVQDANYVRTIYVHQRSLHSGRLSYKKFAEMVGVSVAAFNFWIDGLRRIRSDSARKLQPFAPPNLRPPLSAVDDESLDPDRRKAYDAPEGKQPPGKGYAVKTDEGAILARWVDRITDETERGKALARCIQELSANPRGVATEKRPDRPTSNKG